MNNIDVFRDTQDRILNNKAIGERTNKSIHNTYVVSENFNSSKSPYYEKMNVLVQKDTALNVAKQMKDMKVAVLNFANPVNPGGGVLEGANAQEECLCRATNLYSCLISKNASIFYDEHKRIRQQVKGWNKFLATDRLIYSENILVIKRDTQVKYYNRLFWIQEYIDDWYEIDVITCSAPFFRSKFLLLPDDELEKIFTKRIINILEAAIENNVDTLILGAFGCGVFNNPPQLVAKTFRNVFQQKRYSHAFAKVVFAIIDDNKNNYEIFKTILERA